jgi:glycosyltransferase involved in cell wall biosynthesis
MELQWPTLFYLFTLAACLQLIYWLFFLMGILRLKVTREVKDDNLPGISIIVAARNELGHLKELVPALMEQTHPEFEVIIVNDRSTDGTNEFLIDVEKKYANLKALRIQELPDHISGKKYALTLGIKAASYKQVLLTDADCLPFSSSWASLMASGFAKGADIVIGFSNYLKLPGLLNYFIRFETLLTGIEYLSSAANKLPYMGVGRNLAYKKDLFLENKGFFGYQELIGGDDDLFVNKHATARNTNLIISDLAMIISKPQRSLASYWQQKIRHLHIGKNYSLKTKIALAIFNLSWIFTWILGLWCIIGGVEIQLVLYSLLLREIILFTTVLLATKKFGIAFEMGGVVLIDLLFPFYYTFVGAKALFVKTVSWA